MSNFHIRNTLKEKQGDIVYLVGIILVASISFGAGRISLTQPNKQIIIQEPEADFFNSSAVGDSARNHDSGGMEKGNANGNILVGSKNSNKYHFKWCPGAQKIKQENKIWFSSRKEAESRGYLPAQNCEGLDGL